MLNNRKLVIGILLWIFLALLMVRDIGLVTTDSFGFIVTLFFGLFFSYQIVAYLFGWLMPMLTFTGGLKKGEHDFLRTVMFLVFICFWLWSFFSA